MSSRGRKWILLVLTLLTAPLVAAAIVHHIRQPPSYGPTILLDGTGGPALEAGFLASGSRIGRIVPVLVIEAANIGRLFGTEQLNVLWPGAGAHIHPGQLSDADISPDGARVLTGARDGTARIWQIETGDLLIELDANELGDAPNGVTTVAFSPDGRLALTGLGNGSAWLWRADSGRRFLHLDGHRGPVRASAFSPDGTRLVTGSHDGTAIIWDADSGARIEMLSVGSGDGAAGRSRSTVGAVAFSPDGRNILTGSDDGVARLWQATTGDLIAEKTIRENADLSSVSFSHDGQLGFAGSDAGDAQLWRLDGGELLEDLRHSRPSMPTVAWEPDMDSLFVARQFNRLFLLTATDQGARQVLRETSGPVLDVTFNREDLSAKWVSFALAVEFADLETGARNHVLLRKHPLDDPYPVARGPVRFSRDGRLVVTTDVAGGISVWDTETGHVKASQNRIRSGLTSLDIAESETRGTIVVGGYNDGTARVWPSDANGVIAELTGHPGPVNSVAFSPDGTLVATGSTDNVLRLWSVRDRKLVAWLSPTDHGDAGRIQAVQFSPDGDVVAGIFDNGSVRIWQTGSRALLATVEADQSRLHSRILGPDGRHVFVPQSDGIARVWDLNRCSARRCRFVAAVGTTDDGRPLRTAVSPDNRLVITGRGRGVEGLWTIRDATLVANLDGLLGDFHSVQFDPKGDHVLIAAHDGTVAVWDIRTAAREE